MNIINDLFSKARFVLGAAVDPSQVVSDVENGGSGQFSSVNDAITKLGGDIWGLLLRVGIVGAMIFGAIALITYMASGNGRGESESKTRIFRIALGLCLLFAVPALVGLIANLGKTLF